MLQIFLSLQKNVTNATAQGTLPVTARRRRITATAVMELVTLPKIVNTLLMNVSLPEADLQNAEHFAYNIITLLFFHQSVCSSSVFIVIIEYFFIKVFAVALVFIIVKGTEMYQVLLH